MHRLLDQWVAQLSHFLGIDRRAIGRIAGGRRKPTGRLDVAMLQSLVRGGVIVDLVAGYGHVILDECHHIPAVSGARLDDLVAEATDHFQPDDPLTSPIQAM